MMAGSRTTACAECKKNCLISHQKQSASSPTIIRFFKIMFGESREHLLYLPPAFAEQVKHLSDSTVQLEDATGQRWPVKLTYINGSLSFVRGWPEFYADHGLEKGSFLIFNYTMGSHFVVHIFGASACETLNFDHARPQQNKRSKTNPGTVSGDAPLRTANANTRDERRSAPGSSFQNCPIHLEVANVDYGRTQPRNMLMVDDLVCMIGRGGGSGDTGRNFLSGLSLFELENNTLDPKKLEKTFEAGTCLTYPEYGNKVKRVGGKKVRFSNIGIPRKAGEKGDSIRMPEISINVVDEHSSDNFIDDSEKAFSAQATSSGTATMGKPNAEGSGTKMVEVHTSSDKKDTKKGECIHMPMIQVTSSGTATMGKPNAKGSGTKMTEVHTSSDKKDTKKGEHSHMPMIHTSLVNQLTGDNFANKSEKVLVARSDHSDIGGQPKAKEIAVQVISKSSDKIFIERIEKPLDFIRSAPRAGVTGQRKPRETLKHSQCR